MVRGNNQLSTITNKHPLSTVFRHTRGNQTDFDAIRAAKIEAGVSEDEEDEKYEAEMEKFFAAERKKGRGEMATDDVSGSSFL